jgi:hypothetical protein
VEVAAKPRTRQEPRAEAARKHLTVEIPNAEATEP